MPLAMVLVRERRGLDSPSLASVAALFLGRRSYLAPFSLEPDATRLPIAIILSRSTSCSALISLNIFSKLLRTGLDLS